MMNFVKPCIQAVVKQIDSIFGGTISCATVLFLWIIDRTCAMIRKIQIV